jgi:hypothetical protein
VNGRLALRKSNRNVSDCFGNVDERAAHGRIQGRIWGSRPRAERHPVVRELARDTKKLCGVYVRHPRTLSAVTA